MANDPTLRTRGITLLLDEYLLLERLIRFIGVVDTVPNREGVREILESMDWANQCLSREITTNELVTTGMLCATLYMILNQVSADPLFWKEKHRDTVDRLFYGGPANTVASVGDVTGWHMPLLTPGRDLDHRCAHSKVTVQHKREFSLPGSVLEGMDQHFAKYTGLRISLAEGGGLVWSGMKGKEHEHLRPQIRQAGLWGPRLGLPLTNSDSHADLREQDVGRYPVQHASPQGLHTDQGRCHCPRPIGLLEDSALRQNVNPGTGKVNRALVPTRALAFLSVLATLTAFPEDHISVTKFKRAQPRTSQAVDGRDRSDAKWIRAEDDYFPELQEEALDLELIHNSELPEDALRFCQL